MPKYSTTGLSSAHVDQISVLGIEGEDDDWEYVTDELHRYADGTWGPQLFD